MTVSARTDVARPKNKAAPVRSGFLRTFFWLVSGWALGIPPKIHQVNAISGHRLYYSWICGTPDTSRAPACIHCGLISDQTEADKPPQTKEKREIAARPYCNRRMSDA
jgi:hypothetical protein